MYVSGKTHKESTSKAHREQEHQIEHRMYIRRVYHHGGKEAAGHTSGMAKWGALSRSARVGCLPNLYFRAQPQIAETV